MTKARDLADLGNGVATADIVDANVTQAKLAGEAVNESKLQVSNAPTNGYFLSAQSGNTGGMTWAEAGGDPTGGTSSSYISAVSTTYTGIPAAVRWVKVILDRAEGSNNLAIRLGTSSGIEDTGYIGLAHISNTSLVTESGNNFPVYLEGQTKSYGYVEFIRAVAGSNRWISSHQILLFGTSGSITRFGGGAKTLSGELTQLSLLGSVSGGSTLVQGDVSLVWGY